MDVTIVEVMVQPFDWEWLLGLDLSGVGTAAPSLSAVGSAE
jgi:hypothetical protein